MMGAIDLYPIILDGFIEVLKRHGVNEVNIENELTMAVAQRCLYKMGLTLDVSGAPRWETPTKECSVCGAVTPVCVVYDYTKEDYVFVCRGCLPRYYAQMGHSCTAVEVEPWKVKKS